MSASSSASSMDEFSRRLKEKWNDGNEFSAAVSRKFASVCDFSETRIRLETELGILLARAQSAIEQIEMSGWYSVSGYLHLKFLGGGTKS